MVGVVERTGSLFSVALGKQASLIKDDLLEPIDQLLEDAELLALVRTALEGRRPRSRETGRASIAPDRLLRCCALKHLKAWSFRQLERELRNGLAYRRFTHFDDASIPDSSSFSRQFGLLSGPPTEQIHAWVVQRARTARVAVGRKLRTDTTVAESNIHYPTDSTLLADGVRVLGRAVKRIAAQCAAGAVDAVDHGRAVKHRVLEIHRAAKAFADTGREKLTASYRKLLGITRSVVRQAETITAELNAGTLAITGTARRVLCEAMKLEHFLPLVKQVMGQTRVRVFAGDRHVAGKIVSLFEAHTQVIRKGKVHKPTEFGRLVRIDQVENGIVSNVRVAAGNPADVTQWEQALTGHHERFARAPELATADRGFSSAANERTAQEHGVKRVALPARGKLSPLRKALQKQRWFRRALRWRGQIEPGIATLKHRFGLVRAFYKGDKGFQRWVGWSVITNNLVAIARTQRKWARRRHAAR